MKNPEAWMLRLNLPNFNSTKHYFNSKKEAEEFKDNQELLYRRIKYSNPIPLYTSEIPEGYSLVRNVNKKSFMGYVNDKIEKLFTYNV